MKNLCRNRAGMYHSVVGSPSRKTRENRTQSLQRPNGDLVAITQMYLVLATVHFSTQCTSSVISYIMSSGTFKHSSSTRLTSSIPDTRLSSLQYKSFTSD